MMKYLKPILTHLILSTILMICIIYKHSLGLESSIFASFFFIAVMILNSVLIKTSWHYHENQKEITLIKYEIFKAMKSLDKNNKLDLFEDYCRKEHNKLIINSILPHTKTLNFDDIQKIIETNHLDDLKKDLRNYKSKKLWRDIKNLINEYNEPLFLDIFIMYSNNTIIEKSHSPLTSLATYFSVILSIISLIGLNSFNLLSVDLYISFSVPVVYTLIDIICTSKQEKRTLQEIYNSELDLLKKHLHEFNSKQ